MCGRYTLIANAEAIRLLFELPAFDERLVVPRYNIAPTQPVVVVRRGVAKGRELVPMRWRLIPWWAKDPKTLPLMINARAEGIEEKPAYRDAFKYRRCLVPASGFYEWQAQGSNAARGPKQPYAVQPADGAPIAFAGLWETWHGAYGSEIDSAVIVTTDANQLLLPIHDRMPVVLEPQDFAAWLSPHTRPEDAAALLKPAREDLFTLTPVSTLVNAVANDDPRLLEEAREEERAEPEPRQGSLF
jgi:putative SOS response-associated peptidase YedK